MATAIDPEPRQALARLRANEAGRRPELMPACHAGQAEKLDVAIASLAVTAADQVTRDWPCSSARSSAASSWPPTRHDPAAYGREVAQ